MIRLLIVDDQALVRDGFRMILDSQDDMEVVGEAADGEEALTVAAASQPDVVVMDIRMPGMDGIEATRRLTARGATDTRVLILTTWDLDRYVYAAMEAGASGFLLKDVPRSQLVEWVRTVARGDALLAPAITRRLIERFVQLPPPGTPPPVLEALSEREVEVLRLVARGWSNTEIADHLVVSEATVKSHVSKILGKLGLRDRVQAAVLAYEIGLVVPNPQRSDPLVEG